MWLPKARTRELLFGHRTTPCSDITSKNIPAFCAFAFMLFKFIKTLRHTTPSCCKYRLGHLYSITKHRAWTNRLSGIRVTMFLGSCILSEGQGYISMWTLCLAYVLAFRKLKRNLLDKDRSLKIAQTSDRQTVVFWVYALRKLTSSVYGSIFYQKFPGCPVSAPQCHQVCSILTWSIHG